MTVRDVDVGRRVAPEEDDCCDAHRGDGLDLLRQVLAVAGFGLGDDDVDAEGLAGEGPRASDPPGQCVERHRPAAEHAQGAGVGDGGGELGNGRGADAGVQDGMAYLEQVAHGGLEGSPRCHQLAAFFTSAAILASTAAVKSVRAKAVGHMAPSSRFALSWKPSVAYLDLNF